MFLLHVHLPTRRTNGVQYIRRTGGQKVPERTVGPAAPRLGNVARILLLFLSRSKPGVALSSLEGNAGLAPDHRPKKSRISCPAPGGKKYFKLWRRVAAMCMAVAGKKSQIFGVA